MYRRLLLFLSIGIISIMPMQAYARGSSGGSRSSSSSRSSVSRSYSSSKSSSSSSSSSKTSSTPKSTSSSAKSTSSKSTAKAKPGSKVTTSDGKTVNTSAKKPTNSKYKNESGVTGVDGYNPRFTNGYIAPAGSVVYYPQHSFIDYLPWIYLFSQNSPQNDNTTVVQPDGKEVTAKPEAGGNDGMVFLNWVMLGAMGIGMIALVMWLINKYV